MGRLPSKQAARGLVGWRELTDEAFEKKYDDMLINSQKDKVIQDRINALLKEFEQKYDLDELMPNDKAVLNNLVQSLVLLDMYQAQLFKLMRNPDDSDTAFKSDRYGKLVDTLTNNISKMQDDLKITRRSRRTEKEQSVQSLIADLKVKAKKFYTEKMIYIFCPNCNTLLSTHWVLYSEYKHILSTECHHQIDGKVCGTKINLDLSKLVEKGSNRPELLPESLN